MRAPETTGERHEAVYGVCRMVWRRFGQGPALLLLHGGHGDWRHWLRNIDALAHNHTLWLPDLPGFGESGNLNGAPHSPERMERLLDAVAGTLRTLRNSDAPIDVAGFSFGGLVAARLVGRLQVRRLALLDAVGHGGPRRPRGELRDWRAHAADPAALRAALRHNLAVQMLADPGAIDDETVTLYEAQCRATRFRSRGVSAAGGLRDALAAHAGPLLLLWGEHDFTGTPRELLSQLAAGCSDCVSEMGEGAGHWIQYERAAHVSGLLAGWLARR